jgi:hypothetical protein
MALASVAGCSQSLASVLGMLAPGVRDRHPDASRYVRHLGGPGCGGSNRTLLAAGAGRVPSEG